MTTVSYVGSHWPVWSKPSAPEHNHTIVTENGALLGRPSHVSQLPRTGGESLSLTKALLVNRACRIHLFVLEDEKPAGAEFCFDICFERRWGKGKILDPVRGRFTCKLLSEGNYFGQSVRKETEETGQERNGQKEKFGFYCRNNKGIAAWEHLTFAVKYFWVVVVVFLYIKYIYNIYILYFFPCTLHLLQNDYNASVVFWKSQNEVQVRHWNTTESVWCYLHFCVQFKVFHFTGPLKCNQIRLH